MRSIIDHLEPGAEIERRIELISTLPEPVEVPLYVGAASIEDGSFQPAARDDDSGNLLTSWASVEPQRVEVAPGGRAMATVRIAVPRDAPNGERYAVVWAELPTSEGDVQVVNRVGVRIYLSVGVGEEPPSDFEIGSLRPSRTDLGAPAVAAQVRNTGARALDVVGELELVDGPGGISAGPFPVQPGQTLGVSQSVDVLVPLDADLPAGPWLARLTLRSGELEKASEATIVFPQAAGESAEPVEATEVPVHQDRGVLIPLAFGLLILALVLVFLVWWLKRRRDDEEGEADEGAGRGHATAVAED